MKQRWDNVTSTLKRHCAKLKNGCIDVVQRWLNVVLQLDTDVENSTSDFVSFSTSDQRCFNIRDVKTTLIRHWDAGRVVSTKRLKFIGTYWLQLLLTKWNLQIFFKVCAKTFTTPVVKNFFWWLLLRIYLGLVASNSSSLQEVPS